MPISSFGHKIHNMLKSNVKMQLVVVAAKRQ